MGLTIALDPNKNNIKMGKQLESLFNQEYSRLAWLHKDSNFSGQLKDAYKIFLFAVDGTHFYEQNVYQGKLLGQGNGIPSKAAVVFSLSGRNTTSVICHELLHCLGLFHSFSNRSPFTLQKGTTSNIMDYPVSPYELQTLWKWQWDKIQLADGAKARKEDFIENVLPKIKSPI